MFDDSANEPALYHDVEATPLIRLLVLRILVPLRGYRNVACAAGFHSDLLCELLGIERGRRRWDTSPEPSGYDEAATIQRLHRLHEAAEAGRAGIAVPGTLRRNIERMVELVGLDQLDAEILQLAILIRTDAALREAAESISAIDPVRLHRAVAVVLRRPVPEVRRALGPRSRLERTGLITVRRGEGVNLVLSPFSDEFAELMRYGEADPVTLLRDSIVPGPPPRLALANFPHIRPELDILAPYLRRAVAERRPGVNVYVYGVPGTGKTELARSLAQAIGADLFEVAAMSDIDFSGESRGTPSRLRAFLLGQHLLANRHCLVVFDEAEDAFAPREPDGGDDAGTAALESKGAMHHMLETNPMPVIWLSNSVHTLDPATVRRFDLVLELPVPPARIRETIVRQACGELLDDAGVRHLAGCPHLTPAIITRAANVVATVAAEAGADAASNRSMIARLIDGTLVAQGHGRLGSGRSSDPACAFDPACINCDGDLAALARGLARTGSARLCLHGPPGTGKTAAARWLAAEIGLPLQVERGSDLLSMWVGGTETNLARAFARAAGDRALLLIDEIDGFLPDRRGLDHRWEVAQVNELLVQMEGFGGIFIATTNRMDSLDRAALRRFDMKLAFGYLEEEQARRLLARHCEAAGIGNPGPSHRIRLAAMRALTPGDFAAVLRRHRFQPLDSPDAFIGALERECASKGEGPRRAIGFVH